MRCLGGLFEGEEGELGGGKLGGGNWFLGWSFGEHISRRVVVCGGRVWCEEWVYGGSL